MSDIRDLANAWLAKVVVRDACVLSYDQSLLDQLPEILAEQYGIFDMPEVLNRWPEITQLLVAAPGLKLATMTVDQLPAALVLCGVDQELYSTRAAYPMADAFSSWTEVSYSSETSAHSDILRLHGDLGSGNFSLEERPYDSELELGSLTDYLARVTPAPYPRPSLSKRVANRLRGRPTLWGTWIPRWLREGRLSTEAPSLSVGPRWTTEIRYFREILGLRTHRGIDLFSSDPDLVDVGDMHAMPYPDSHFQMVFVKNTLDKSYDLRQAVSELARITKPGGLLIVDQVCGYGVTTPLTRTDIQGVAPFAAVAKLRGFPEVVVERTTFVQPEPAPWAAPTRRLVQMALVRQ